MTLVRTRIAIVTAIAPLTLLAVACDSDQGDGEDTASADPTNTSTAPTTAGQTPPSTIDGVDYLAGRAWHQVDGDVVELPKGNYSQPVLWNGRLVTLQPWGEATGRMTIFDDDGAQVDEVEDVAGFAVSNDGTILSYTTGTGDLIARWDGGQELMAQGVVDTGGGESVGGAPVSVIGTAPCEAESGGCLIRINTFTSGCRGIGSSDVPLPSDANGSCADEQDGLLAYSDTLKPDGRQCGGIWSGLELGFLWHTCDFRTVDISPDGKHVMGGVDHFDGLGYTEVSIHDVETGEETGSFRLDDGDSFVWYGVEWSAAGVLLMPWYDGADWHLSSMTTDGTTAELAGPVTGKDYEFPWELIRH